MRRKNKSAVDLKRILEIKAARGFTFRGLAAMVSERSTRGVSWQMLESFMAGKSSMNVEHVAALASVLGVSISEIVHVPGNHD